MVNRPSFLAKTSFEPSGDHAGSKPLVSFVTPVPLGVIKTGLPAIR